jgi:IclR family acetate operon transcriptional repressor
VLLGNLNLGALGHDVVRALSRSTAEAAHLAVLIGSDAVFVDRTEGSAGGLTIRNEIGAHDPTYCTAIGRALLSGLSDSEVRERLREVAFVRYTPRSTHSMEQLIERLGDVRRLGYAHDDEEKNVGVSCLAAPVNDHNGHVVAAVGISGPTPRLIQSGHQKLASIVVAAGRTLSMRLGFDGPFVGPQLDTRG